MGRKLLAVACAAFSFDAWILLAWATTTAPSLQFDYQKPAGSQIPVLHQAWLAEHDKARRRALAEQLLMTIINDYDEQPIEIADEVARDGAPKNEIMPPSSARAVVLNPLFVLKDAPRNEVDDTVSPVFRRIAASRIEAWTSREGRLFDARGKNIADVAVPRRDGFGREWFGAFLPSGAWITTDLWANDEQINCYDSKASWLWELPGKRLVATLPKPGSDFVNEPIVPSIGWARADKTGRRWLVCLGFNYMRGCVLVDPARRIEPLSYTANVWNLVYPRSMGVRGMYTELWITSDDGEETLHRSEAGHGVGVGWPNYGLSSNKWNAVINGGNEHFGFWPHSHAVYIETGERSNGPKKVWLFDSEGKYEGEAAGSFLGDAANGKDILINDDNEVMELNNGEKGAVLSDVRSFKWPDTGPAIPLAIYDDLKLGFFLRGPNIIGSDDDARRARSGADIVLASW
jgi:hypothetical protein